MTTCKSAPDLASGSKVSDKVPARFSSSFRHNVIFFTLTGMVSPPTTSESSYQANRTTVLWRPQYQRYPGGWEVGGGSGHGVQPFTVLRPSNARSLGRMLK